MDDLKLYVVNDKYIEFIRDRVSWHVFSNTDPKYNHSRKYLGVVLNLSNYRYYVPLSSPKNTDFLFTKDGTRMIRKSIIPIMRMIDVDENNVSTLLGTLKFSNMVPVPDNCLTLYDLDSEMDVSYKDLVEKEVRYINRHTADILKCASVLHKQKLSNLNIKYLNSTLDFEALEIAHDEYCKSI